MVTGNPYPIWVDYPAVDGEVFTAGSTEYDNDGNGLDVGGTLAPVSKWGGGNDFPPNAPVTGPVPVGPTSPGSFVFQQDLWPSYELTYRSPSQSVVFDGVTKAPRVLLL